MSNNGVSKIKGFINLNVRRFSNNRLGLNIDSKNNNKNLDIKGNNEITDLDELNDLNSCKKNKKDNNDDYLQDIIRIYYDIDVSKSLI